MQILERNFALHDRRLLQVHLPQYLHGSTAKIPIDIVIHLIFKVDFRFLPTDLDRLAREYPLRGLIHGRRIELVVDLHIFLKMKSIGFLGNPCW
jgi:hypothetical protein